MAHNKEHAWVYADKRWNPLRVQVMARDQNTCRICGKLVYDPRGPWTDRDGATKRRQDHPFYPNVDHITPLDADLGLAFDIDNLRLLHAICHQTVGQRESRGVRLQRNDGW